MASREELSLIELFQTFPDDEAAERWFVETRWPDGPTCPHCEHEDVQVGTTHPTMPFRCRGCRKFFSVRTGSVMENSKLGYQKWAIATFLVSTEVKGASSLKLHRALGIPQKTAWHLAHRIRKAYEDANPPKFDSPVEVDETYVGGKYRNMHSERRKTKPQKLPVVGIIERETGRVYAKPINSATMDELVPFVHQHTEPGTQVYADEAPAYNALHRPLETVAHSRGEYVRDEVSTNLIESFWAELKRSYHGSYHWWSHKHLGRYVDEIVWRHNHRQLPTLERIGLVAAAMVGRSLTYEELTDPPPERMPLGQMTLPFD